MTGDDTPRYVTTAPHGATTHHLYCRDDATDSGLDRSGFTASRVRALCQQVGTIGKFVPFDPDDDEAAAAGVRCLNCIDVARTDAVERGDDETAARLADVRDRTKRARGQREEAVDD